MGRFQDGSETTAGGSPSQDRVTEQASSSGASEKKVSGWTPVSGTDMAAFAVNNSAGVYISNSEISPKGTVLYEALCLHPFVYSTTGCKCEFSIKKS